LTTIQLASRIHRLRRRKHRFPLSGDKSGGGNAQSGSGSSGPDPSSSDFSADTVIYVGPHNDDATDNEHPPVFLPNLNSGDNRCAMNKALKGSAVEKSLAACKSPIKKANLQKRKKIEKAFLKVTLNIDFTFPFHINSNPKSLPPKNR
jgi:kinesin family member 26